MLLINFSSYTKHLGALYTKQTSKHNYAKHVSERFHAQLKTSQRCLHDRKGSTILI